MADLPDLLKIGERSFPIEYEKVLKATSSVRIKNGRVVLKLSRFLRGRQLNETVSKFLLWAEKRLAKVKLNAFVMPDYCDGGRICTHNKVYDLKIVIEERRNSRAILTNGHLVEIFLSEDLAEQRQFLAEKVIMKDQLSYLCEVLDELNQLYFQESFNACRFKRVSSRFGSCSSKRNINIAYRLLFAPREVFRYVCVHELAHLKEFNHSKKFWDLVHQAMPDYKIHEQWLRHNGFMLG